MVTRREINMKDMFKVGFVILALQICFAVFTGFNVDEVPLLPGWTGKGIWLSSWIGAFIYPGLLLYLLIAPYTDSLSYRKLNVSRFDRFYPPFFYIYTAYLTSLQIYATLGGMKIVSPHLLHFLIITGMFLIGIGNVMPRAPYGAFPALPLPWLFKSEKTWRKSHRFMGFTWFVAGVILIAGSLLALTLKINRNEIIVYVVRGVVICLALIPIPYSYFIHKKTLRTK
jgi:uncharacterized membrane protein